MNNMKFEQICLYPGQIVTAATDSGIKRVLTVTLDDISKPKYKNCRDCALKLTELCKVVNCGDNHLIPIDTWQTSK